MEREAQLHGDARQSEAFDIRYSDVVDAWLGTHASSNTRAAYRADLGAFSRWCADNGAIPLRVDAAAVAAFQSAREQAGDSASTQRRRWSSLSSFYQFAVEANAAAMNPVAGAERPKVLAGDPSPTTVLSPRSVDEYLALAAALDPRLEALVALLVFDGLKLGEALALDVDDLTGKPPKVSLVLRRNGTSRRIVLDDNSARAVHRCAARRRGEPLFTRARSGASGAIPHRLTRFGADHLIKMLNSSGGGHVTANALRRFHITASHGTGIDIDAIRERVGLDDVRTIRRYLQPHAAERPDDRDAANTTQTTTQITTQTTTHTTTQTTTHTDDAVDDDDPGAV